jgi:hypothetical protein
MCDAPSNVVFGPKADIHCWQDGTQATRSNICDWHFINFMAVLIHNGDEPAVPIPARHNRAMF